MRRNQFREYLFDNLNISRLWKHFINFMKPCFLDVFIFSVASARHNHRLFNLIFSEQISYFVSCNITVHDGHAAIDKYETIRKIRFSQTFLDKVNSLSPRIGTVNNRFYILVPCLLQNDCQSQNIERFIINK